MEVIRDEGEREARLCGDPSLPDQLGRRMVFGRKGEAELHHPEVPVCRDGKRGIDH